MNDLIRAAKAAADLLRDMGRTGQILKDLEKAIKKAEARQ